MNKEEFLRQLEQLLSGITEEERADAVAFYRSYFEDAGEENEAAIVSELESPQKVADSILKNLGIEGNGGYYNTFANRDAEYYNNINQAVNNLNPKPKKDKSGMVALGITIAVLTSPLWLTLLLVVASVLLAIVCALFGVAVAVAAVMVSLIAVGFVILGIGFSMMFAGNPAAGIGLAGGGCIVLALGMMTVLLAAWIFGVFLPWACKGIVRLCKMPFQKRKERMAS